MEEKYNNKNIIKENNINTQGLKMWIREYKKYDDIDVEFEDGYISYNRKYYEFKKGKILNINYKRPRELKFQNRIGEINCNVNGSKMEIVEYNFENDVIVKFENGYKTTVTYGNFKHGNIRNPYDRTFYGIGYIGEGKYKGKIQKEYTIPYKYWSSMLVRCYSEKYQGKEPTYRDCTVCDEWHNFQNFGRWYDENYYKINNEEMNLDKDILHKGNKIYSPENCIFVPKRINALLCKRQNDRGEYPIGVDFHKSSGKFRSRCNTYENNKTQSKNLGMYLTSEEAFFSYKNFKENYIKQVADEYKDYIPQKLYDAMYKYEVEITD